MRKLAAMSCAVVALAGCGDLMGLGGYTDAVDGGGGDATDGGGNTGWEGGGDGPLADSGDPNADGGGDAALDGGDAALDGGDAGLDSGADSGPDSGPDACVPVQEDCTNGIDDDCNGFTDCLDSACTVGFACVPPLPGGWAWTAYTPDTRPACAKGYNNPVDVEEGINAPNATCGCACGVTNPDCTQGNLSLTAGANGACDDNNNGKQSGPASAGCHQLNKSIQTSGEKMSVTGPAPSGGSCTPNPSKTAPPVTYQHEGRTCAYSGSSGGGCSNGDVCAPKAPLTACVSKLGSNACPKGFSVPHLVGSTLADTRGCTACTCGLNSGTCTGTAAFYTDKACTNGLQSVLADTTCHAVADQKWQSYKYTPQNSGVSCTPSAVNPTGSAVFSDLATVCCVN